MTKVQIDLEFVQEHGVVEAFFLAFLRHNEVANCPPLMSTHSALRRAYPFWNRATYRKAMMNLEKEGYITTKKCRMGRGRPEATICTLTDKAFQEYRFGE